MLEAKPDFVSRLCVYRIYMHTSWPGVVVLSLLSTATLLFSVTPPIQYRFLSHAHTLFSLVAAPQRTIDLRDPMSMVELDAAPLHLLSLLP